MTVAARRPSRNSFMRCTSTAASRPARLGTAARLLPSVPWQLAQFAAMSRPRFAYGPTSAAEAELIRPASASVATAPDKSRNFGPPSILSPVAHMPISTLARHSQAGILALYAVIPARADTPSFPAQAGIHWLLGKT